MVQSFLLIVSTDGQQEVNVTTYNDVEAELLAAQADALRLLDNDALADFEAKTQSVSARVLAKAERGKRAHATTGSAA